MAAIERLVVKIDGDGKGLTAELQRLGGNVDNFAGKINKASNDLTAIRKRTTGVVAGFRDIVVSLSSVQTLFYQAQFYVGGFLKKIVDGNAQYERMTVLLHGLSKATTQAGKDLEAAGDLKFIRNMAKTAPFELAAISDSFVRLKTIGIDPMQGGLKALTDSVAAFGGDSETLKRATLAIQQMAGKGVISMEELRQQLGEAVPNAVALMARSVRMGYGEFVKAVSEGKVRAGPAIEAFFQEAERVYGGAGQRMMDTYTGLMQRLKTTFQEFALEINKSPSGKGFFDVLKTQIQELSTFLSSSSGKTFARDMGESIAYLLVKFTDLVKVLYEYRDAIATVAKIGASLFLFKTLIGTFRGLGGMIGSVTSLMVRYGSVMLMTSGRAKVLDATTNRLVSKMNSLGGGFVYAGGRARGLIVSMARMGAQASVLIPVIAALAAGAYELGRGWNAAARGRRALADAEKAAKFGDILDEDELNAHKNEIANQKARKKTLEANLAQAKANINAPGLSGQAAKDKVKYYQGLLDTTNKTITGLENSYVTNRNNATRDSTDREAANFKENWERGTADMIKTAQINRAKRQEEIDKAVKANGDKYSPELTAKQNALDADFQKWESNAYRASEAKLREHAGNLKGRWQEEALLLADDFGKRAKAIAEQKPVDLAGMMMDPENDKKAKGPKSDGLDGLRNRFANLKVTLAELRAELAGTADDFDSDPIYEEALATAQLSKSKGELTTMVNDLTDAIRKQRKENKFHAIFEEMDSDIKLQKAEVNDLFATIRQEWISAGVGVDAYGRKLEDQHSKELADVIYGGEIRKRINDQIAAEADKQFGEQFKQVWEKNKAIEDSYKSSDTIRQEAYEKERAQVQDLINNIIAKGNVSKQVIGDLYGYLDRLDRDNKLKALGPLGELARTGMNLKDNLKEGLGGIMDGFINDLADGKFAFKDFAKSILKMLLQIIIRAIIAKAILSAIGMGSGSPSGDPGMYGYEAAMGPGSVAHTGGIVGQTTLPSRNVASEMFAFANRYHSGGMVGLKEGEVPIIAKRGEGVFTQEQMKALGKGGGGNNVQVNVINQTSNDVNAEQSQPRFDGEKFVVDVVLKNASKPGPIRDMLQGIKNG